jgi:Caspase domain
MIPLPDLRFALPLALALSLSLGGLPPSAASQDVVRAGAVPNTYALLIGQNPGGEGQDALRYAERDAQRMAEVLRELGRFPASQTQVLLGPDKHALLGALTGIGSQLQQARARGEQAQLVFYYSGHARADAIQLGAEQLALSELRERLLGLPTTLTLIVLDACQSGAFSRVKGAVPAAEFSHNSVTRLQTSGVAVMASSTGSELSQESELLRGSYFTHHLVVALRGAGDGNRDGVVSLAEAYRYAYEHTLSATARTAVGGQHVTLETALTGQGEVPITYPAQAAAQLELPGELAADVLIERSASVIAELHKVHGAALRLALPAGGYVVVLRRSGALSECSVALQDGQATRLVAATCKPVSTAQARAKGWFGLSVRPAPAREAWSFELGFGIGASHHGAYTQRLEDFGWKERIFDGSSPGRLSLTVARQVSPHLSVLADLRNLEGQAYQRTYLTTDDPDAAPDAKNERFAWQAYALGIGARAHVDLFGDVLRPYAQLGGGLGYARTALERFSEHHFGLQLMAAAGVFYMPWRHFGFSCHAAYFFAPVIANALDERQDSGGVQLLLGLRLRLWGQP